MTPRRERVGDEVASLLSPVIVAQGVFLTDLADFEAMTTVYSTCFPSPQPVRTTVQVAGLPGGIKVEMDCVVVLLGSR